MVVSVGVTPVGRSDIVGEAELGEADDMSDGVAVLVVIMVGAKEIVEDGTELTVVGTVEGSTVLGAADGNEVGVADGMGDGYEVVVSSATSLLSALVGRLVGGFVRSCNCCSGIWSSG